MAPPRFPARSCSAPPLHPPGSMAQRLPQPAVQLLACLLLLFISFPCFGPHLFLITRANPGWIPSLPRNIPVEFLHVLEPFDPASSACFPPAGINHSWMQMKQLPAGAPRLQVPHAKLPTEKQPECRRCAAASARISHLDFSYILPQAFTGCCCQGKHGRDDVWVRLGLIRD